MKKLLTFLTLLTLFFGVGWAETVTLTQSVLGLTGSYTTDTEKTIDGITYVYTDLMKNNENIQAKASSGEIHNKTAYSGDITSVAITHSGTARSTTISGSSDGTNWTQVATGSGSITGDFTGKGYKYFKITRGSNAAYWTKIEITYSDGGSQATTYSVTCNEAQHGSISAGSTTSYAEGATVTVTATPQDGYKLGTVTVTPSDNGVSAPDVTISGNTATFTMPASNVTVDATFTLLPTYGITVTGGTASPTSAYQGQTVTLTPTIPNGQVVDWDNTTVSPSTLEINHSDYTFTMPGEAVTVAFAFKDAPVGQNATYIFNTTEGISALGITPPTSGGANLSEDGSYVSGDVTMTTTHGSTNTRIWYNSSTGYDLRVYGSSDNHPSAGTLTFTVPSGCVITQMDFTYGSTFNGFTVNTGEFNSNYSTWTGSAQSVTLTSTNGQNQIKTITIYYSSTSVQTTDLYIIGQVNGLSDWSATKAVKMTYDGSKYTAKFYVTGEENSDLNNQGQGTHGGTFAFTTKIGSWGDVNGNRYEPPFADEVGGDKNWWLATSGATNSGSLYKKYYNNSFLIPAGLYEIEVDKDITTFNLKTIKDLTPAFDPASGDVNVGSSTTLATAEDFNAFIASCNAFEGTDENVSVVTPEVKLYINNSEASTYEFKTAGEVTLTGKAALVAGGTEYTSETATATFTAVQKYSATIASGITGGSVAFNAAGTQTTLNNLTEGYEVRVYVTPSTNYELTTLTYTAEGSTTPVEITTNAGDSYTFNMPAANVTINATFTYNGPAVTGTTYELINSTEALEAGKKYLVVYETSNYALGGTGNGAYSITIDNHQTTINSDSEVSQFVLGGSEGAWTLYNGSGYLYHTGTSASSVNQTGDGTNDASKWTISFSGDNVTLTSNSSSRLLRYYNQDFRAYQSTSNGQNIQLYKEVGISDPKFSIPAGVFQNSDYPNGINVALTCATDGATIYYSTDGTSFNEYSNAINVKTTTTVYAYATKDGMQSNTVSATYRFVDFLVSDVVFSPARGTYYDDQTCQMFSTTKGARIYYTTDGSDPVMNQGTTQLYTGEVPMPATATYNFKAVAYIGTTPSGVSSVSYNIRPRSEGTGYNDNLLFSVAELNAVHPTQNSDGYWQTDQSYTMVNPVQVIYMSSFQNDNEHPEFCLVRDNTGYGMIYFARQSTVHTVTNGYTIHGMGDWISGGYNGKISYAVSSEDGLLDDHPEMGTSARTSRQIYNWPTTALSNSAVLPEYLDIPTIMTSVTGSETDYWGHYVHLRKNTINLTEKDEYGKWSGMITDEKGNNINYYDKFYLQYGSDFSSWTTTDNMFTGHPNRTFDVYGFVAKHIPSDPDYQLAPFAFAWIDKPTCSHVTGNYTSEQTVSLSSLEDPTATIWYKTSDMDDYAVYTEPFEVNSTTTVSWYATKQSQYNDELESLIGEITMTFDEIPVPVISPESQVLPIADGSYIDATIAFEEGVTTNAVIYYTIDGSDPKTSENVYVAGETTLHFTTTTTVRAIAAIDGIYSAEAEARTYTFVKSNGIVYDLVTNVSQLTSNGVYVIVSRAHSEAMSNVQNTSNRGAAGVMFVPETDTPNYHGEEQSIYGNDDVAVFTVTPLSHEGDTDPLKRFLFQTNNGKNSASTGYLYVGSETNNTLLTEATEDELGNDVAVVSIDADGRAHIYFNYSGGENRYLQYWNRDRLFNTYKSEYDDRAVYIYYKNATPLATIEKEGVPNGQYTIADQLLAVYADVAKGMLWCKDQGNVSIAKTEKQEGQIDFMKEITKEQTTDWDQSNWVVLQFDEPSLGSELETLLTNAPGKYIKPATISGTYSDVNNYTITMADQTLQLEDDGENYVKNLYCTANFLPKNLNINGGQGAAGIYHGEDAFYFFMNPKVQEVCEITYAQWDGNNTFIVPLPTADNPTQNDSQIDGAFTVDWTYNVLGPDQVPSLSKDAAYKFWAVVQRSENSGYLKSVDRQPSSDFIVYPLNLDPNNQDYNNIVTAINTIEVGNGQIKSVKYVNVAGMVSDKPFSGVNIVVTEYTDGSRSTTKMLRK